MERTLTFALFFYIKLFILYLCINFCFLLGRFEDELIEYRMTMLQSWMDRICHHPVLAQCEVLRHFLTCPNDEKTWKSGKRKAESDKLVGVNFYQAIERPEQPLDLAIT